MVWGIRRISIALPARFISKIYQRQVLRSSFENLAEFLFRTRKTFEFFTLRFQDGNIASLGSRNTANGAQARHNRAAIRMDTFAEWDLPNIPPAGIWDHVSTANSGFTLGLKRYRGENGNSWRLALHQNAWDINPSEYDVLTMPEDE